MKKYAVSVAIPAVIPLEKTLAYRGFMESDARDRLFVQFVYLRNLPKPADDTTASHIQTYDTHEILYVSNDRYYSSCEENMYRIQDFTDLLNPYVFFVGDHDLVDWNVVVNALEHAHQQQIDAMGLKIISQQMKPDGSFTILPTAPELDENTTANINCRLLMAGESMPSDVGFTSMVSNYGAIDWVAYIGSHLFSKQVFSRLMQYHYSDYIYSLIYKMAHYFTEHPVRYGFFSEAIIYRVGEEFIKAGSTDHSSGWLGEHRAVHGQSPNPWISNIHYLQQMDDPHLFNLMVTSRCIACEFHPNGDQRYQPYTYLQHPFWWSERAMRYRLEGKSFYFPEYSLPSGLQDLRYIMRFYQKLLQHIRRYPDIYTAFTDTSVELLDESMLLLSNYLSSPDAGALMLHMALTKFSAAQTVLLTQRYPDMNQAAFRAYMAQRR